MCGASPGGTLEDMTTTANRRPPTAADGATWIRGAGWAAGATAGSYAVGAWALAAASGVTHLSGSSYSTEFIDGRTNLLAVALLACVYLAARQNLWTGLAATAGLVAGQWWAMAICVQRYSDSGWGDGLEVLGFGYPILLGLVGLVVTGVVRLVERGKRRAEAQGLR
jgi:hypothetical protein